MSCDATVESAERAARGRAVLMALAGAILPLNAVLQWGDPAYVGPTARGAVWVLLILGWMALFANGGGLRLRGRMRELLNDELSLRNRARAVNAGFYVTLVAALVVYLASWRTEIATGDAIKLITAVGLSTALFRYAWLEWRQA